MFSLHSERVDNPACDESTYQVMPAGDKVMLVSEDSTSH